MSLSEGQIEKRLQENLAGVRERIAAAAARAGRTGGLDVMLVGVTKYVDSTIARLLIEAGLKDLGESRPQELWKKADALADHRPNWHLIGSLQRNKVKRTLRVAACIHSVDSLELLREIQREAATTPLPYADLLLEVNVSGEPAKHGFRPDVLEGLLPEIAKLNRCYVLGLMAMAAAEGGAERARRDFAALRELRDRLRRNCPPTIGLQELSMGMSGDFEVAIEEGATMVRVGSALFEGIE
jgi:pyridoxal phosphate enzyme (YggS family)